MHDIVKRLHSDKENNNDDAIQMEIANQSVDKDALFPRRSIQKKLFIPR